MNRMVPLVLLGFLLAASGCLKMKHDITIQPIHVTVEITVKIDQALNDFFGDIDKAAGKKQAPGAEEGKK